MNDFRGDLSDTTGNKTSLVAQPYQRWADHSKRDLCVLPSLSNPKRSHVHGHLEDHGADQASGHARTASTQSQAHIRSLSDSGVMQPV